MISNKMKTMVSNSSVIRAMFEEGKRLSEIYGEENVFDYSIGNPNIEAPSEIKDIIIKILNEENPNKLHGYMNNSGYEDVREGIAENINVKYNTKLNYENIVMTCGAAGGLNIILKNGSYKSGNVFLPARKPTKCSYHSSSDIRYSYINLLDELSLRDCNAIS